MVKGVAARIRDMLETIEELERATADKTFEAFSASSAAQEQGSSEPNRWSREERAR